MREFVFPKTIFAALVALGIGCLLYAGSAAQFNQCRAISAQAIAMDQGLTGICHAATTWHFGSFAIIGLGAVLLVLGFVGKTASRK
jgi:hypothetical protein